MKHSIKNDRHLSTETIEVFKITISGVDETIEEIACLLDELFAIRRELSTLNTQWLLHPISFDLTHCGAITSAYYIEASNKLNKIFANKANLMQKIAYLGFVGVTDAIDRHPLFREAVTFHRFSKNLSSKADIDNVDLSVYFDRDAPRPMIRKIHAVHQTFLQDEEIKSGLNVSYRKKNPFADVLYVCSPETLELAIQICEPNSVLIIDGHWEHDKKSTHGVWEFSSANEIAINLAMLLHSNPNKIKDIRLWGCEAGYLADFDSLPIEFEVNSVLFKDESRPEILTQDMGMFRNRARYYSKHGEFPFARGSLAGQIIYALNDASVSVTASNSRTYPYPFGEKAQYNFASDSSTWRGPHFWLPPKNTTDPEKYNKLRCVKSLTFKYAGEDVTEADMTAWPSKFIS